MKKFFFRSLVTGFWLLFSSSLAQAKPYDYLIKDATVFDGRSLRGLQTDVAIKGDRIREMGEIDPEKAEQVIRAKGFILAPGFIDPHTHSDFNPIIYPSLAHKLLDGVTTEIVGNCGMSAAPVLGAEAKEIHGIWAREGVEIPKKIPWQAFREYWESLEAAGMRTNIASLAGHGNLRAAVMGFSPRPASEGEIERMEKILDQAMSEGAKGISFGLVYVPGIFAEERELVELCREAARRNGICTFHIRSESSELIEALKEAIAVGQKAQAPIQISHLKAAGKKNWNKIHEAFLMIEAARAKGMKILADAYPYTASQAELGVLLPDELYKRPDRVRLFRNPLKRGELLQELRRYFEKKNQQWDAVAIAAVAHPKYRRFQGKTIKQIARETKKEPETFLAELLADTAFEVSAFYFNQDEGVVEDVIQKPYVSIGSDSIADGSGWPHPRAYGSFAKILREYVRENKFLEMGEAVRKMTSQVAEHFNLEGRGEIKTGYYADLVLFDPNEIADESSFEDPKKPSRGVKWVFVNGRPEIVNGRPAAEKSGRFL